MKPILLFLPESARLYATTITGIRRGLGELYSFNIIDTPCTVEEVKSLLRFWAPAGCIIGASRGYGSFSPQVFKHIPVVYLDRTPLTPGNYLDVQVDTTENGHDAARELLLSNWNNYAFVGSPGNEDWSRLRGESFIQAISLHKKNCAIFPSCDITHRPKLLAHWLKSLPKPSAIFAANDLAAKEVHHLATSSGLRIPDQLAILGIDNIEDVCESVTPKLSSICTDFEQGGRLCAELLLARLHNPSLIRQRLFYGSAGIIRRRSTAPCVSTSEIKNVLVRIKARIEENLSVSDIAEEMGCSRRTAEIRFKRDIGQTIQETLTELRLERATTLLFSETPIERIAKKCGYGSSTAFRIAFKKKFNMSPRDFREKGGQ